MTAPTLALALVSGFFSLLRFPITTLLPQSDSVDTDDFPCSFSLFKVPLSLFPWFAFATLARFLWWWLSLADQDISPLRFPCQDTELGQAPDGDVHRTLESVGTPEAAPTRYQRSRLILSKSFVTLSGKKLLRPPATV